MSKKVLLISNDDSLISFVNTTILTLTKLNNFTTLQIHTSEILPASTDAEIIIVDLGVFSSLPFNLKNLSERQDIQSIAITAKGNTFSREEIFSAGVNSIMTRKEFFSTLSNILTI